MDRGEIVDGMRVVNGTKIPVMDPAWRPLGSHARCRRCGMLLETDGTSVRCWTDHHYEEAR